MMWKKNMNIWNEVVEKVTVDYEGSRKKSGLLLEKELKVRKQIIE